VLDITDGTLAYATAGHPLPYLLRRKQQQVEALKFPDAGAHPALGLFDDSVYEACTLELSAGDLLLLYTDGVTEARNEEGEDYTPERLVKSLHKRWNETPQQLLHRLTDDIRRFIGAGDFQDDVCLLAVEYSGCRADGTP
jgi:sigma-B regulation protein RsbU (phosphoserine phosphatase)